MQSKVKVIFNKQGFSIVIFLVFLFNSGESGVAVVETTLVHLDKLIDTKTFKNKLREICEEVFLEEKIRDICKDMLYARRVSSFSDCEYETCQEQCSKESSLQTL